MKDDCLVKTQKAGGVSECMKVSRPLLLPFRSVRYAFMFSTVKYCFWVTPISYCKKKGSNRVISHTVMVIYKLSKWEQERVFWSFSCSVVLSASLLVTWEYLTRDVLGDHHYTLLMLNRNTSLTQCT